MIPINTESILHEKDKKMQFRVYQNQINKVKKLSNRAVKKYNISLMYFWDNKDCKMEIWER